MSADLIRVKGHAFTSINKKVKETFNQLFFPVMSSVNQLSSMPCGVKYNLGVGLFTKFILNVSNSSKAYKKPLTTWVTNLY
jgi:hypothetical protein